MSSIASKVEPTLLSDFTSERVVSDLGIDRQDTVRVAAIHAFFKYCVDNWVFHPDRAENIKLVIEQVTQTLHRRLGYIDQHAPSFMEGIRICKHIEGTYAHSIAKDCAAFLLTEISEEYPDADAIEAYKLAEERTFELLEYPLSFLSDPKYANDFFGGSSFKFESLVISILTKDYLRRANGSEDPDEWEFDKQTLCCASLFADQAEQISDQDVDLAEVEFESLFCFHVDSASKLHKMSEDSTDMSLEELQLFKETNFPAIEKSLNKSSLIGQKITALMKDIDEEIESKQAPGSLVYLRRPSVEPRP